MMTNDEWANSWSTDCDRLAAAHGLTFFEAKDQGVAG
jgi:hypothetical protein